MNNVDIRQEIFARDLKKYDVARAIGVTPATFSLWLQTEMSPERKRQVMRAIKSVKRK